MRKGMKKKGDKHRPDGHQDGTGIPPGRFSGKKPEIKHGSKTAVTKGKKARDLRLSKMEM
jgi:hypothetical protein